MLPLVRGGVGVCIPLGEVDCGCLATGLPLLCEVVFVLPRWRLYWLDWWSSVLRSSVDPLYCLGGGCIG